MKSMKTVKEAYAFLGLTLAFSYFVFWGPLALFKIPTISFVSDVKGPVWAIALFIVGGFVPSLLAIFLTWIKEGLPGLRLLGKPIIQFKLGWRWYMFTFLIVIAGTAGQLTINKLLGNTFPGNLFLAQLGSFLPLTDPWSAVRRNRLAWICLGKTSDSLECIDFVLDRWYGLGIMASTIVSDWWALLNMNWDFRSLVSWLVLWPIRFFIRCCTTTPSRVSGLRSCFIGYLHTLPRWCLPG